jgi:hypothetical protein
MSAKDPAIGGYAPLPFYHNIAAVFAGLPLRTPNAMDVIQLTIVRQPNGSSGRRVKLDIHQLGKPLSAGKKDAGEKGGVKQKGTVVAAPPKPAATVPTSKANVRVGVVPPNEPAKLDAAEIAACQVAQEPSATTKKLQAEVDQIGLSSAKFWRVRSDYYEQELPWRRDVLGAASVQQLCKSMIMENTRVGDMTLEEATAAGRIKYVCVVLQYAGAKLQKEKLTDAVRRMEGSKAVGKKQYSLRMVAQEVSDALSGCEHNAVTLLGMNQPIPVLLSDKIRALPEGKVWLGGGEVDVKLRCDVAELVEKFKPNGRPCEFADVTE